MKFNIKELTGTSFFVEVENNDSILTLKQKIFELENIPVTSQRLICKGRELMDNQLIGYYNLEEGNTIHLVQRKQSSLVSYGTLNSNNSSCCVHNVIPIITSNPDPQCTVINIENQENRSLNGNGTGSYQSDTGVTDFQSQSSQSVDLIDIARMCRLIRLFAIVDCILTIMLGFWGNLLFLCALPLAVCGYIGAKKLKRVPLFLYGIFILLSIAFRIYLTYLYLTWLMIVLTVVSVLLEFYILRQLICVTIAIPKLTMDDRKNFADLSNFFI